MLASALWAYDPDGALSRSFKTLGIFSSGIIVLIACRCLPDLYLKNLGKCLLTGGIFALSYLMFEKIFNFPLYRLFHSNQDLPEVLWSAFQNKSIGALALLSPVLLLWPALKFLRILFAFLLLSFLSLTINQTSQIVILVGLIAFIIPVWKPKISWIVGACSAALILSAPALGLILFKPFAALGQSNLWLLESSASMRLEIWQFVSLKILESPFIGFGVEATRALAFTTQKLYFPSDTVMHPHNGALQIWIEFGALGAIFATLALLCLWFFITRQPDNITKKIYSIGFCMIFFVSLESWGLWQGWLIGLIFLISALLELCARAQES